MQKDADAFRTIGEVAEDLDIPQHVLRFWETRFPQIKPLKRAGGRRFYRPADVTLLRAIRELLYGQGYTIKGVQKLLKEQGAPAVATAASAPAIVPKLPVTPEENGPAFPHPFQQVEAVMSAEPPVGGVPSPEPALRLTDADRRRLETVLADLAACTAILSGARIAGR